MAEIGGMLAAAVLKAAAGKVSAAAVDRVMLQWRFDDDLRGMRDMMESIEAVLDDAERRSITDASVRLWLKRLTTVSYSISDMFDEFEVNTSRKSALWKFKVLNPFLTLASEIGMAAKMKKVREKLDNISKQRHEFSFTEGNSSYAQQVIDERETKSEVIEADILGRDQEKRRVIALLTRASTSSEFIILPIYGIGGIGKTTLAQLLFNDKYFKDYEKAWVYVSQIFDLKKIDDTIRSQLQKDQRQLTDTQEPDAADPPSPKKILIVLDDLWENDDFKVDDLKHTLKRVLNGYKVHVIVTTRDADIARKIQTTEAYPIEPLSSDVCWTIIKQIVGFEGRADRGRLEDIGKEIAMKCGGVALTARALGYMLRSRNFFGWVSVKDNGIWNASATGYTPSPYDNVLASLKLSYISMQPFLRLCFAYCAIFPRGHKMTKDDLIYQWAALGFLISSDEVSTWLHGESCIMKLLGMSFLQHSRSPSSYGQLSENATLLTMHDLVHDLARSIMRDEILDGGRECNIEWGNYRYALLADCRKPLNLFETYHDNIRAIRFLESVKIGRRDAAKISTAKYLRVLDFGECSIQNLPPSIGQLKLLRYLNAPGIKDAVIPSSITKLSKLIYLNLRGSSTVGALPESIGELNDLMYLDLSACSEIRELPESFGKLRNLVHLDFSKCSHVEGVSEYLENLTNLQYLNLSYCKNIGVAPVALSSLTRLQYLNLSCSSYFVGMSNGEVTLSNGGVLGTLTNLKYLNLSLSSAERSFLERLPEALGSFTELNNLNLSGCKQLEELPRSFGQLRNLVHLDLSDCYQVNGIPDALRGLTKLQYLNLSRKSYAHYQPTLQGLSEVTRELTDLRYLNLSGCIDCTCNPQTIKAEGGEVSDHIGSFLDIISALSNLEHLDLSHNLTLYTIPDKICSLRKLHTLDLSYCRNLESVPENIGDMESLKCIIAKGCLRLDISTMRINNWIWLPNFMVHVPEGQQSSNLVLLKDVTPPELEISALENVRSVEEAHKIKLKDKLSMVILRLYWTGEKERFLEDMELLREFEPPSSLEEFELRGYNSVSFPAWLMDIAIHLPNLVRVKLDGLSHCSSLPPLGQLPNLKHVNLTAMHSIVKIDRGFCGGVNAFARLEEFFIYNMGSLEEWSTVNSYGDGEDVAGDQFMFPNLKVLRTCRCHKLKLNPCLPRVNGTWHIIDSNGVLLQWEETSRNNSSALVYCLRVTSCRAPMHHWMLLHHLHGLSELVLDYCGDLSCSSEIIQVLASLRELTLNSCGSMSMTSLPEWLVDLTSLQTLKIKGCRSLNKLLVSMQPLRSLQSLSLYGCPDIRALPESLGDVVSLNYLEICFCEGIASLPKRMQQLVNLERLTICGCPALEHWCKLPENKMKISHVKESLLFHCGFC